MDKNRFYQLLESTLGNVKPLISEQKITDKLVSAGFKQVNEINLLDGTYVGNPNQQNYYSLVQSLNLSDVHFVLIYSKSGKFTGYVLNIYSASRSGYYNVDIEISGKKSNFGDEYWFKESGFDTSEQPQTKTKTPIFTITESTLINAQIPAAIIQASPPLTMAEAGKGQFTIEGSDTVYAYDLSSKLPNKTGEYYFLAETADFLNQKYPEKYNAKQGTHYCGFVDEQGYGMVVYVDQNGKVLARPKDAD